VTTVGFLLPWNLADNLCRPIAHGGKEYFIVRCLLLVVGCLLFVFVLQRF